jgi:hypothetical protein
MSQEGPFSGDQVQGDNVETDQAGPINNLPDDNAVLGPETTVLQPEIPAQNADRDGLVDLFGPRINRVLDDVAHRTDSSLDAVEAGNKTERPKISRSFSDKVKFVEEIRGKLGRVTERDRITIGRDGVLTEAEGRSIWDLGGYFLRLRNSLSNEASGLDSHGRTLQRDIDLLRHYSGQIGEYSQQENIIARLREILSDSTDEPSVVIQRLGVYRQELQDTLYEFSNKARDKSFQAARREDSLGVGSENYAKIDRATRNIPEALDSLLKRTLPQDINQKLVEVRHDFSIGQFGSALSAFQEIPLSAGRFSEISDEAYRAIEEISKIFKAMASELDKPQTEQANSVDITE